MKTPTLILAAALAGGVSLAPAANPVASGAATPARPAQVEPGAVAALSRMSAYLRSIPAFQINLQTRRDDVDVYGQLITLSGGAIYKVRRPDAFSIDLALPSLSGRYVYDGNTMTLYDATTARYARIKAPPTIRAAIDLAEQKYGAIVPLEDLFKWSEGDDRTKALTAAHYVGKVQIGGQAASHYAFRQPGVDWQIWIADGAKPAPLRVTIVAAKDPARPQFQADLAWNTAPQFTPVAFAFAPPANARPIELQPAH
jgi:hypothetical protein